MVILSGAALFTEVNVLIPDMLVFKMAQYNKVKKYFSFTTISFCLKSFPCSILSQPNKATYTFFFPYFYLANFVYYYSM